MTAKKRIVPILLTLFMVLALAPAAVSAEESTGNGDLAKRTILMYICGTDLETKHGMASYNLRQILNAGFSADEDVNVIVMTGGATRWHLEEEYLSFSKGVYPPDDAVLDDDEKIIDPKSRISNNYNQIWEARGKDAKKDGEQDPDAGKLVLIDGDGITGDEPIKSQDELVIDPDTLKAFINYGAANYPAEKYDLILWDHGGGPAGGYGGDDHKMFSGTMPLPGIVDAIRDNAVTNRTDEDPDNDGTFDFIDFDACLMSNIELNLVLADYTDYYIGSAEIEPGYGQDYTGWLNSLGTDPQANAFALGKQMVDDYVEFYENGPGKGQQGTLAVIDSKALINSGITAALSDMGGILRQQAENGLFYDEIHASKDAIRYSMMNITDLGNFASLVSVTNSEVSDEELDGGGALDPNNAYSDANITQGICSILNDPEIVYAGGTSGIRSGSQVYRSTDGTIEGGEQPTSGMSFFFIFADSENSIEHYIRYYDVMTEVVEMMPDKTDGRYQFLKNYKDDLMDYALLTVTGSTVNKLISIEKKDKSAIDYALVKEYLKEGADPEFEKYTGWGRNMKPLLDRCDGGESAKASWLDTMIKQQAAEAVSDDNITTAKVKQKNGIGYQIKISDTRNRIIDQVQREISLEVPAMKAYLDEHGEDRNEMLTFGSVSGSLDISSALQPGADISDIIRWYNGKESEWILDAPEKKWYAIKDAEGKLHAAAILKEDESSSTVLTKCGEGENEQHLTLTFGKGAQENKLIEISDVTDRESSRPVRPSELKEPLSLMPALSITGRSEGATVELYIPTSDTEFTLSGQNADDIVLVYTDIEDIRDIQDTDGDGTALHSSFSVANMYGHTIDISDAVNGATDELIDIDLARVRIAVYDGKEHTPEIVYLGEVLREGTDYTWELVSAEDKDILDVGDYDLLLTGKGRFTGVELKKFRIVSEEDAVEALVEQAQTEFDDVKAAMDEAVSSGNDQALQAVYTRFINAQRTLTEALNELIRTRKAQSAEQKTELKKRISELEKRISELEKQIEDLNKQIAKLMVVDISNYAATLSKTSYEYTGKEIKPSVTVSGLSAADYTVTYSNNKAIGKATVTIKGKAARNFKGTIVKTFQITKRTNPLRMSGLKATVKFEDLKKKTQTLAVTRVIKFTKDAKDKKNYTLSSATKGKENFKKYFEVNKTTGKVTVKKGLKKGIYKLVFKVKALGTNIYKVSGQRTVTFRVIVQ